MSRYIVDLAGTLEDTFQVGDHLAVLENRSVSTTAGDLVGGGDLSANRTLSLAATAVSPGSYGDASHSVTLAVDSKGRLTGASHSLITPAGIGAAATSHNQAWSTITSTPTDLAGYGITDAVASSDARLTDSRAPSGSAGGDLTGSYPNPTLAASGVVAATYGDATHVPQFTVDAKGRVTAVTAIALTATASGAAGGDLTGTYPNPTIATGAVTNAKLANSAISLSYANGLTGGATVALGATLSLGATFGTSADTFCQGNDSRLSDSRAPTGAAGGSLTGTYPNPTIAASAIANSMVSASAAIAWSKLDVSAALPSDIGAAAASHTQAWSTITSTPTTRSGYGITDAASNVLTIAGTKSITGGGDLSANRTLELVNDAASPGTSQYYGTNSGGTKGWFSLPSASSGAPIGAQYVVIAVDATLTSERVLTAGAGLTLVDSGAGAAVTLSASFGSSSTTVCVGNDARLSDSRVPTGAAGGDLSGTYPNPTLVGSAVVTAINSLSTADLKTGSIRIVDTTDVTKKLAIALSGITTLTTRSWSIPDRSDTFAGLGTQTFTGAETFTGGVAVTTSAMTVSSLLTASGGLTVITAALTVTDVNVVLSSATGTKIGTATNQKLAFYNSTPIVKPTGDVITALQNLGLVASATVSATALTGIVPSANGGTGVNNAGTITNASNTTITGGGTFALGGFTLTVPATGTAALLATANVFTVSQTINLGGVVSGYPTTLNTGAPLILYGDGANANRIALYQTSSTAGGNAITGYKGRGNGTTPTATQQNDQLWQLGGRLYGATAWSSANRTELLFAAAENCTDSAQGTYLLLSLTPIGSTTITNTFKVFGDASLQLGGTLSTTLAGWGGGLALGGIGTSGNGFVQRASGTTKANGDAWGTDCFLYRSAAGQLTHLGTGGVLVQQAATQDAIIVLGRAGGTSSYAVTLTPATMSASYTLTIPALGANDTLSTLGLANIFTAAQTINVTSGTVQTWKIAGTQIALFDTNGLLGLGSITPTAGNGLLQLTNTSNTRAYGIGFGTGLFMYKSAASELTLENSTPTASFAFGVDASSGNYFGSKSNHDLRLLANYSEKMRITTNGNILIATTTEVVGQGFIQLVIGGGTKANSVSWDATSNLYCTASGFLKTDAALVVAGSVTSSSGTQHTATATLGASPSDAYLAGASFAPTYNGAFTVTRHNYLQILQPAGAATITDACVFRFDAAAGTHKAVDGSSAKATPSSVQAWVKININGTIHFVPCYTSKTA